MNSIVLVAAETRRRTSLHGAAGRASRGANFFAKEFLT